MNAYRRVSPDGVVNTVAGGGVSNWPDIDDGEPATDVALYFKIGWSDPMAYIDVGSDGSLYIGETNMQRYGSWYRKYWLPTSILRMVDTSGIIHIVAGGGKIGYSGDGGLPTQAELGAVLKPFVARDGSIYIFTDTSYLSSQMVYGKDVIRRVSPLFPGFSDDEIIIASEDGSSIYFFDANGRHLRTVNALTGAVIYSFYYNSEGLLIEIEDGNGNVTTIERDADGNPAAIIAPFGQCTVLTLDEDGYLGAISTDPAGNEYVLTYDNGLLRTFTNPGNQTSVFTYSSDGKVVKDEGPTGGFAELVRTDSDNGFSVTLTTAENNVTNYLVEKLPTGGRRLLNTFACCGTQTEVLIGTDGSSQVTYGDGTVTSEVEGPDPRFGMQAPVTENRTLTTPGGVTYRLTSERTASLTDPADVFSVETLTDTTEINGRTYTTTYNLADNTVTTTTPEGRQAVTTIDQLGRPLEIQVADLETITYSYDTRGRISQTAVGTRQSSFVYDPNTGYLKSSTNPLNETIGYDRDVIGRITSVTLPNIATWGYERDEMGNLVTLTEPDGSTRHNFTYTEANLLETYESPMNAQETFTYDKDRRLTRREFPSTRGIEWTYNTIGQVTAIRTPEGDHAFAYDTATGRLTQAISRDGQQVDYTYDGSLLRSAAWSNLITGSIGYTYDNDLRVSQMEYAGISLPVNYDKDSLITGVGSISLSRDAQNGLLIGLSDGDFQVAFGRNTYGEVSSVTAVYGSTLYDTSYTYDALGRIARRVETIAGTTHTYDYEYDSVGQLTTVREDGTDVESYTYDNVGNRTGINNALTGQGLSSSDYTYDADNKLLGAGTVSYGYDADGRLQTVTQGASVTTYHYNTDGTLASADLPDGRQITYLYDSKGRRITRAVDGVKTHSWMYGQGLMPLAEYDGSDDLRTTFIYGAGATPIAMVRGGTTYHIVTDHLGSPRLVVDDAGTIAKQVDYDSFGNVINDTNPGFDLIFGFAGGMTDPDHELIRFGARDYQPSAGRWTAKDPIFFEGGDLNLYGYVGNDPVNYSDRSGLEYRRDPLQTLLKGGIVEYYL